MVMAAPRILLLDTNIWLDYYMAERPFHDAAFSLVDCALSSGVELVFAITSPKDLFYQIGAGLKRAVRASKGGKLAEDSAIACNEIAWGCISNLDQIATGVGMDVSDLRHAIHDKKIHRDFEDNLIMAAARRARADYLVTNDKLLLRHSDVPALSAEDTLSLMQG